VERSRQSAACAFLATLFLLEAFVGRLAALGAATLDLGMASRSAASFAVGASLPLLVTVLAPASILIPLVFGTALLFLALLGALAARTGGAGVLMGALRVTFWGALAMGVTAGVGALFGTVA
jgi:VIT1/CCC1 family predicted Fe2+/Mn2+ transporter